VSPEERLARLEARQDSVEDWLRSIDQKVDDIRTAANMGKGAWKAILWVGGIVTTILAALAWVWDHLPKGWHS
jgi:vacuolar-type H+-ATPase subunit E/Vma4